MWNYQKKLIFWVKHWEHELWNLSRQGKPFRKYSHWNQIKTSLHLMDILSAHPMVVLVWALSSVVSKSRRPMGNHPIGLVVNLLKLFQHFLLWYWKAGKRSCMDRISNKGYTKFVKITTLYSVVVMIFKNMTLHYQKVKRHRYSEISFALNILLTDLLV